MDQPVNPIIQLIPLLTVSMIYGGIAIVIGRRKVENLALWTLLCLTPIVNMFALTFLISKTDKTVIKELTDLRARVDHIESKNT